MVSKSIISKTFDYILIKCSNQEIMSNLSSMSVDEKRDLLKDKMNPFEFDDYNNILDEIEELKECYGDEELSVKGTFAYKDYEYLKSRLFDYEKRIFRGYDLNKNVENIPSFDIDDFISEEYDENNLTDIGVLEQAQIRNQQDNNLLMDTNHADAFIYYFGSGYTDITGELMPNTFRKKNNINDKEGYWNSLGEETQRFYHEQNKGTIKLMDESINKSDGLLQPTVLWHGTMNTQIVNANTRLGDRINLKGYISTSFQTNVNEIYSQGRDAYVVKFLAPTGTKGLCANDESMGSLTNYPNEHEYLLGRGNKGTVVDIDYDNGVVTVLLDSKI